MTNPYLYLRIKYLILKIEILGEFKKKYGEKINPLVTSFKYCQSDDKAYTELTLKDQIEKLFFDLEFIASGFDFDEYDEEMILLRMFDPKNDLIDNARLLIEFDDYNLLCCIEELFIIEA